MTAQKCPPRGNGTGDATQEGNRTQMHTQTTSQSALAALMETAHDCGYTVSLTSMERGHLTVSLHERDDLDHTVPVANDPHTTIGDGTISAASKPLDDGMQWVNATTLTSGMAVEPFIAAVHQYFCSLAISAVAA